MLYARTRKHRTNDMCIFPLFFEKHFFHGTFHNNSTLKSGSITSVPKRFETNVHWLQGSFFLSHFMWLAYFSLCHVKRLNFQFLLHFVFALRQLGFECASKRFRSTQRDENYNVEESSVERCTCCFFVVGWKIVARNEYLTLIWSKASEEEKKECKRTHDKREQIWTDLLKLKARAPIVTHGASCVSYF